MKQKSQMETRFVKPLSCLTLSIITTIGILPPATAQETSPAKSACEQVLSNAEQKPRTKQVQKLAQFADPQQERSQLIQQANALFSQGDLPGAEVNLCKFLKKYSDDAFGHFQLGNVFFRGKKVEAAISAYQEAIRLKSRYAVAYNALGIVYASQNRWSDAIAQYQKALEINPDYGDALTNVALVLWQTNKKDEALVSLEKALNIFKKQNRNEKANQVEQLLQRIKNSDDNLS
ncbi:TPR repeat protein [Trichormus variabilis ATCC 29413]|uniref:TPR repeat protein n=2 Tax=Anabaena variabilis TaxID=264691 RepID=Q3M8A1_TRIV2|nr:MULTISPECIES: tetratricopeptide repeat protein [Nostocaceae]ABA22785.1 TPR repeat protein [Trichormus variabilis ATCC 29413]MBC1217551.1 tetratricopeptide repeat protein [Trichormus variabilis ARAD]MBC1256143.1 tetratricopeptide repeat protein [Trichormus variabilis V5]MBC1268402.1 tetratricopeptide repeat protein [Trichormus variabilis FSR]MBC1304688.1 tetratricopeptide repeat protein [Trichormus variabilis N2B]